MKIKLNEIDLSFKRVLEVSSSSLSTISGIDYRQIRFFCLLFEKIFCVDINFFFKSLSKRKTVAEERIGASELPRHSYSENDSGFLSTKGI